VPAPCQHRAGHDHHHHLDRLFPNCTLNVQLQKAPHQPGQRRVFALELALNRESFVVCRWQHDRR
jgi:hypothetical protein